MVVVVIELTVHVASVTTLVVDVLVTVVVLLIDSPKTGGSDGEHS